jgi:hypothetical protein
MQLLPIARIHAHPDPTPDFHAQMQMAPTPSASLLFKALRNRQLKWCPFLVHFVQIQVVLGRYTCSNTYLHLHSPIILMLCKTFECLNAFFNRQVLYFLILVR